MARTQTDAERLRMMLVTEMHRAATDALGSGGAVSSERLDALGRLARLAGMVTAAATPAFYRRWAVQLVALATLVSVSFLLFARVSTTEVAMDLKVSELSFVLPTSQPITDEMTVTTLGVAGLRAVDLPDALRGPGSSASATDLYLATELTGRRTGAVSLSPITLPAGSRVALQKLDGVRHYRLALRGATSELAVSVNGTIQIVVPPAVNEVREFSRPRPISLQPDSREVTFDVVLPHPRDPFNSLRVPLPAESLFLFRVDRFDQPEQTLVRQVSTIDSGVVYFESIEGRARPLRAGEGLHFAASFGEIRDWRLTDDGVLVRFEGRVRGMSTGSGGARRSLMPTMLEWLRAQHGLSLLWGTTVYIVGLFITVLGWWRRPP